MCGLVGWVKYGKNKIDINTLTESLLMEAASRGTDATGIAYNNYRGLQIVKKPVSAYKFNCKLENVNALTGHTRHATQGSAKVNINNQPFFGKVGRNRREFALSHNGVLLNDVSLRKSLSLPKTKIETDSYISVQLIESQQRLDMKSIAYMAEKVQGSYSFSILDSEDSVYLVRGESPLYIMEFPEKQIFVYGSTSEIVWRSLIDTDLFPSMQANEYTVIDIKPGEIVKLCHNGKIVRGSFKYDDFYDFRCDWRSYGARTYFDSDLYVSDLKSIARNLGYTSEEVDELIRHGYTYTEIEDFLYGMEV